VPNPHLIDVFIELAGRKPVVITSDMYLPERFFEDLFRLHGLPTVPMFISSERNATKRDCGELFDMVVRELGVAPGQLLHIGDNALSDIERARERRLATFHYVNPVSVNDPGTSSPSASIASGLIRIADDAPTSGTLPELGYRFGGPAAVGFLDWIADKARDDKIDLLLFVSRDGYILNQLAGDLPEGRLPRHAYFQGSRVAFSLAATDESNFHSQIDFFLAGSQGLMPIEVLERLGVSPPADEVMEDLGLGADFQIDAANVKEVRRFFNAFGHEVLKICSRNRRGLFQYLRELGVEPGMRIAMVDVGWNGTTQQAFAAALEKLMSVELHGYYLCLNDTPECAQRRTALRMDGLLTAESIGSKRLRNVYANRVAIELLFSAPHDSVIGYVPSLHGDAVTFVQDPGRAPPPDQNSIAGQIVAAAEAFSKRFGALCRSIGHVPNPLQTVLPLVQYAENAAAYRATLKTAAADFDAWASTRNKRKALDTYIR
jgi:hypothetical protein